MVLLWRLLVRRVACVCGRDCTARVWSTDRIYPLRVLAGHRADVECVSFHPNCQYVATGSADCSVRLWDVASGDTARLLLGHTHGVAAVAFSPDGRSLFSAAHDGRIIHFDLASARIVQQLGADTQRARQRVTALAVSGGGEMLATGTLQGAVSVWDVKGGSPSGALAGGAGDSQQPLQTWRTKSAALTHLRFTPRNLLLAAALFQGG